MDAVAEVTVDVKNVPALRFPEFEGEWIEKRLGDGVRLVSGQHLSPDEYNTNKDGVPYFTGPSDFTDEDSEVTKWTTCSKHFSQKGDVLITVKGSGVGTMSLLQLHKVAIGRQLMAIKSVHFNGEFVYHFLLTKANLFIGLASGNMIPGLSRPDILTLKLKVPSLPEQQKIAFFFSAIDDKIQQLSKKKELLEKYKKGLMQQIFSQQIRFKDANGYDYPEWEERKLGDVLEFYPTNSFSRSFLNYEEGSVKNIHYGDIHTQYRSNFDITEENVPYINVDVDISRITESSYCKIGDLVIADASEDYKDIGKAIEIANLNNESVLAGLHTYIARDNNNVFSLGFKGCLMQSRKVRLQVMRFATGVSVLGISKGNIAKVEIGLPGLKEQRKIVSFLTSVDNKINYTSKQLEQTQQFKKGLLQQMFV